MDLKLLEKLTQAFGPSGYEDEIRADDPRGDRRSRRRDLCRSAGQLGRASQGAGGAKKLILAAHMDEIGVMVTHVEEKGYLRFTSIGGVWSFNRIGGRVRFADGTEGVVYVERREDKQLDAQAGASLHRRRRVQPGGLPDQRGRSRAFHRPAD